MTKKIRPWVQFVVLAAQAVTRLSIIRLMFSFCGDVVCKYVATTFDESFFSHHSWTLSLLIRMLDFSLIVCCIHFGLRTLREDLKLPVDAWLERLYRGMKPKNGDDVKPEPPPEKLQLPAQRKTVVANRRKQRGRRRPHRGELKAPRPAEIIPAAVPRQAKPQLAQHQEKNQALDS